MESLGDTTWDVLIAGTGLQQSLLALSLSRSGKKVLHVDPNEYYGGAEAAFSLQEADAWAAENAASDDYAVFSSAEVRREGDGLSFPRAYSLALAPQLVHTKSKLLDQLVSSRSYRQVEFLAVGSFFVFQPATPDRAAAALAQVPSTREAVFSSTAIPVRAKRSLMKFLKFVLAYDAQPQTELWHARADTPLAGLLGEEFRLDAELRAYIVALTLSLDGQISVRDGLAAIHRHLTSVGVFGPGFAAVYPKWGGGSEVAQVACRAGAVGGGVYMLATALLDVRMPQAGEGLVEIDLSNDVTVRTRKLVQSSSRVPKDTQRISRLVAVVPSNLSTLFEVVVEGAPIPAVAVVAFPTGSLTTTDETTSTYPVYAIVHSSDTGECPVNQSVLYLTTIATPHSKALLDTALAAFLAVVSSEESPPKSLYQLYYQQARSSLDLAAEGDVLTFPPPPLDLAFNDSVLEPVQQVWEVLMGGLTEGEDSEYMTFQDREGVGDDDSVYD